VANDRDRACLILRFKELDPQIFKMGAVVLQEKISYGSIQAMLSSSPHSVSISPSVKNRPEVLNGLIHMLSPEYSSRVVLRADHQCKKAVGFRMNP